MGDEGGEMSRGWYKLYRSIDLLSEDPPLAASATSWCAVAVAGSRCCTTTGAARHRCRCVAVAISGAGRGEVG